MFLFLFIFFFPIHSHDVIIYQLAVIFRLIEICTEITVLRVEPSAVFSTHKQRSNTRKSEHNFLRKFGWHTYEERDNKLSPEMTLAVRIVKKKKKERKDEITVQEQTDSILWMWVERITPRKRSLSSLVASHNITTLVCAEWEQKRSQVGFLYRFEP